MKQPFVLAALALAGASAAASASDLQFPPSTSAGHDFNHAPIGQTFLAPAARVRAGIYLADEHSFTSWLQARYPSLPPYPYAVAPSIRVNVKLLEGEGVDGAVLDSRDLTLAEPFMGFVDVDYGAAGVALSQGAPYTMLLTDISGQAYPNGVTGWVVPAVHDYSTGASLPPGAYADGHPLLQGAIVLNDAGIGDNSFEVIDLGGATAPPVISGTLPGGQVGVAFSATLTASGGSAPFSWSASGTPAGLSFANGSFTGSPSIAGTFPVVVGLHDAAGATAEATYSLTIAPASTATCSKPKAAKDAAGKGRITAVGSGYIVVGTRQVSYSSCTQISFGSYQKAFAVGQSVEWEGWIKSGATTARVITVQ